MLVVACESGLNPTVIGNATTDWGGDQTQKVFGELAFHRTVMRILYDAFFSVGRSIKSHTCELKISRHQLHLQKPKLRPFWLEPATRFDVTPRSSLCGPHGRWAQHQHLNPNRCPCPPPPGPYKLKNCHRTLYQMKEKTCFAMTLSSRTNLVYDKFI